MATIAGLLVLGAGAGSATLASSDAVVDTGGAGPRPAPKTGPTATVTATATAPAIAAATTSAPARSHAAGRAAVVTGDGTVPLTDRTIDARKKAIAAAARKQAAARAARSASRAALNASPQGTARALLPSYGWNAGQFACLKTMWFHESSWNPRASNPGSGAYGIPQALPGDKMAMFGSDWRTNPATQIRWGLWYIKTTYGSPCQAWAFWQRGSWY